MEEMEIKGLNNGYANAKKILVQKTREYNKLSKELEILQLELQSARASKQAAILSNNDTLTNMYKTQEANIESQIKAKMRPLEKLQEVIAQEQYNIDSRVKDLRENPEVQKKIDELLAKKYTETIKKKEQQNLLKEKKE